MRVRVDKACRVAYSGQVLDLAAGTEVRGEFGEYLAVTGAPVTVLDKPKKDRRAKPDPETPPPTGEVDQEGAKNPPQDPPAPPVDGLDPEAPVGAVLEWVANDPERARQALAAETAKADKARAALVARLTALAGE